jgi:hypothetical protein
MMRNGRPEDQNFRDYHRLYYRFETAEDIEGNRLLGPRIKMAEAMRAADISVNWSKYSKPWDVVFDFPRSGIAMFFVWHVRRDLPTDLSKLAANQREQDKPKPHTYKPVHEPEEDNYSHSAMAVFKDGVRITKPNRVAPTAKKEFRQIISDKSMILLSPGS